MHTSAQDRALWGRRVPQWSCNTREAQWIWKSTEERQETRAKLYLRCSETQLCISCQAELPHLCAASRPPKHSTNSQYSKTAFCSLQVQPNFCPKENSDPKVNCWHTNEHLGTGLSAWLLSKLHVRLSVMLQHTLDVVIKQIDTCRPPTRSRPSALSW